MPGRPPLPMASEGEASGADRTSAGQSLILVRWWRVRQALHGRGHARVGAVARRPGSFPADRKHLPEWLSAAGPWRSVPSQAGPACCRLPRPAGRVRGLTAHGWARARPAAVTTATAVLSRTVMVAAAGWGPTRQHGSRHAASSNCSTRRRELTPAPGEAEPPGELGSALWVTSDTGSPPGDRELSGQGGLGWGGQPVIRRMPNRVIGAGVA